MDNNNQPVSGLRAFRVRFFDSVTTGTQLGVDQTGSTSLSSRGQFNIYVQLPAEVLNVPSVWYELAIDTDNPADGDPSDDVFPMRIRLVSVPFAVYAQNAMNLVNPIAATKIADGSITNNEFLQLHGVSANIQAQLDAKANSASVYTKAQTDASQAAQDKLIAAKANSEDVYTRTQVDTVQAAQDAALSTHTLQLAGHELLLTSHTLRLASHDAVLTSFSQELAFNQALLTTHTMQLAAHDLALTSHSALLTTHTLLLARKMDAANVYTKADVDALQAAQDLVTGAKANTADVNAALSLKADAANVYTKAQMDTALAGKSATSHSHNLQDLDGAVTDAQVPNTITIDRATSATFAATADRATTATHAAMADQATTATYASTATTATVALGLAGFNPASKADATNVYTKAQVDASQQAQDNLIAQKANSTDVTGALALKADAASVYTKAQMDTALAGKSATSHSHNLQDLGGAITDAQVPNTITIDRATSATFAATADRATTATHAAMADQATTATYASTATTATVALGLAGFNPASKADVTNVYTKAQVDASQTAQNTLISQKADAANVYTMAQVDASQQAQDNLIAQKANLTTINTALALKANNSDVNTTLALKADAANIYDKATADARYLQTEADTLATVTGRGATTTNVITVGGVNSNGPVVIPDAAAPGTTTNKLYATGGDLYWAGTKLNGGGGGGDGVTSPAFFGDGSAGSLVINSATDWNTNPPADFNTKYTDITINATLTVPSGTKLYCTGNVTIGSSGRIVVQTFAGSGSPGVTGSPAVNGTGGTGMSSNFQAAMIRTPDLNGGGGGVTRNATYGSGGYGGGSLLILCHGNINIQGGGAIEANGSSAVYASPAGQGVQGSGGGAGGVVVLASAGTITVSGAVTAIGGTGSAGWSGNGGSNGGGGGGGGGIVHFICATPVATTNIFVAGGAGAPGAGPSSTSVVGGGGGACGGNGGAGSYPQNVGGSGGTGRIVQTPRTPASVY